MVILHLSTRLSYVSQSTANFRTPKTQKETILASSFRTTFVQSSPKPEQKEGVVLGRRQ